MMHQGVVHPFPSWTGGPGLNLTTDLYSIAFLGYNGKHGDGHETGCTLLDGRCCCNCCSMAGVVWRMDGMIFLQLLPDCLFFLNFFPIDF